MTDARNAPLTAFVWMMGAVASFSLLAIAAREAQAQLDTFELMVYRSAIGIVIVLGAMLATTGGLTPIRPVNRAGHLGRNLVHFVAQNLWFFGVAVVPLAQMVTLEFTYPLFVAILAPLLLGERLTGMRVLAAVLGFLGVLIVARPGYAPFTPNHWAGLGAAVGFALTAIITRRLSATDGVLTILFWMVVIQGALGLLVALPGGMEIPEGATIQWVLAVGVTGLSAHFCLTSALNSAPASVVTPMEFVRLPVVAILGMAIYQEPLESLVFVGGAVIFAGVLLTLRAEARRSKEV